VTSIKTLAPSFIARRNNYKMFSYQISNWGIHIWCIILFAVIITCLGIVMITMSFSSHIICSQLSICFHRLPTLNNLKYINGEELMYVIHAVHFIINGCVGDKAVCRYETRVTLGTLWIALCFAFESVNGLC